MVHSEKETPFEIRKEKRKILLVKVIKDLLKEPREHLGVSTLDIWENAKNKGYHYDYRTLYKDLLDLEITKIVYGITVFGGKNQGTKKYWRI